MKQVIRAVGAGVLALGILGAAGVARADEKVTLGVAIPTADHGFTGGIVWWANEAKTELEKAHPDLKIIVKTASGAPEQANQLQDLVTVNKINALVVFPFESASLTQPDSKAVSSSASKRARAWSSDSLSEFSSSTQYGTAASSMKGTRSVGKCLATRLNANLPMTSKPVSPAPRR